MSRVVDINRVSGINQNENPRERMKKAAQDGDVERLYELIAEDPNILQHFDEVPFCETPLHVAAEKGKTHFAIELMTLKPSLALKLNVSGFSPMHLALQKNHIQMVRRLIAIDSSIVSIKGRGRITPLHHVARIGDSDLLSQFLCSCPSSVEDLTIKGETAVHIAVKNHQLEAVKVLLECLKEVNREEILDWKDEDGNTILHIAASTNQIEVMKLLRKIVKVNAKNLDGKTAMDILRTHQSSFSPEANGTTTTLENVLSQTLTEKLCNRFGLTSLSKIRHRSSDSRSVILVVAILIATTTYQASLSPPGGFWQENSKPGDKKPHLAGHMVISFSEAVTYFIVNGTAFFSSLFVIMILITGLPMWRIICFSMYSLLIANYMSIFFTFPSELLHRGLSSQIIVIVIIMVYVGIPGFTMFLPWILIDKHSAYVK